MDQILLDKTNNRKFIRYIRKDIKASITKLSYIGFHKIIDCQLIDISPAGAQFSTQVKLSKNAKLTLMLIFENKKELEVKTHIVNIKEISHYLSVHEYPTIGSNFLNKAALLSSLDLYESDRHISAKYRELSKASVKILTQTQLNKKEKHSLVFNLSNGVKFKTTTKINNCQLLRSYNYGVKFDRLNDKLSKHLHETHDDFNIDPEF